MPKNPFLLEEEPTTNPFLEQNIAPVDMNNIVAPITGAVGGGFGDSRSGGARKHRGIDYQAPAGSEFVAPTDLVYLRGGVGGTNLRPDDRWAHFGVPGTSMEWRIAHQGELPEPGATFKQGEKIGTIGSVIKGPHLHAGFYDTNSGEHVDIGSNLGIERGMKLTAGQPFNPFSKTEQKMTSIAASVNPFLVEPSQENNPFLAESAPLPVIAPTTEPTFAPTKEQAEAAAKASGVEVEPGLGQPTFLDPVNIVGGLPAIGRSATGGLLSALTTRPGLTAMAKATPGFLGSEAVGGAAYSALEGDKNVPEWAKLPLAMAAGVGGGLASSKLGQLGAGAKLRLQGGKSPIPPDEVILSELTTKLSKGVSAQEGLKEIASKYGTTVPELMSKPATPVMALGSPVSTKAVKNPFDSSELGAPVVTKQLTTNADSTLGPKGTVVDTIPLHEGHLSMRQAFVKSGADIVPPRFMSMKNTFKTNERIFSELDDIAPGFQDEFWGKLKQSENIAHKTTKSLFKEIDDIASQHSKDAGDKIGIDLISKRRSGMARLEKMGKTITPLTAEESQVAQEFQGRFKEYLVQLNKSRALANKQPIKEDPNYITFMSNFVNRVNEGANPITANANLFIVPQTTPFKFEKAMKGSKEAIETNLFTVFKNYAALAEKHINISPHLEKIRKFVGPMTLPDGTKVPALSLHAPNASSALKNMAIAISGVKPPMNKFERMLSKASDNLVLSTLGAYPKSVINQIGSLAAGGAEVGPINLVKGLMDVLKPGSLKYAADKSHVLAQRKMDVVLEQLGQGLVGKIGKKMQHYSMVPLEVVDNLMAHGVWNGAVRKGLKMGLSEEAAHRYADKVVPRTQASASNIDRAMIQNSVYGKLATAFQTFAIADANWIARNIFGQGNINFKTSEGIVKLIKISAIGMLLNNFQRNVLGLPAGLPEPIRAMQKAKSEGAGRTEIAWEGIKEVGSKVPVVGSLAYGKAPMGALGSLVSDVGGGFRSPAEALAMLSGVPGMNMMLKGLKTSGGREFLTNLESKTGLPVGPRTALTRPPLTAKEILLGKEPLPRKRKPWRTD